MAPPPSPVDQTWRNRSLRRNCFLCQDSWSKVAFCKSQWPKSPRVLLPESDCCLLQMMAIFLWNGGRNLGNFPKCAFKKILVTKGSAGGGGWISCFIWKEFHQGKQVSTAVAGYLPEAIRNYLARLSWSHGDDEIFSTEQVGVVFWAMLLAVVSFNQSNVNKSIGSFLDSPEKNRNSMILDFL